MNRTKPNLSLKLLESLRCSSHPYPKKKKHKKVKIKVVPNLDPFVEA